MSEALTAGSDNLTASILNNVECQIGARGGSGNPQFFFDGQISEVGIWNRELSAAEAAMLASRFSPLHIPRGLVAYLPLIGRQSPEIDHVGRNDGTVTGATVAIHPRVFNRAAQQIISVPVAAAAGIAVFRRRIEGYR